MSPQFALPCAPREMADSQGMTAGRLGRLMCLWCVLLILLVLPRLAGAAITINSVSIDGGSATSVPLAGTIAISLTATVSSGSNWRDTGWRISATPPGTTTCANTAAFTTNGTYTASFSVTAPSTPGTYNLYLVTYANSGCGGGGISSWTSAGKVTVGAAVINSVTLNGANSVTTPPSMLISTEVNVTTSGLGAGTRWRATGWRISTTAPGTLTCVNHADHDAAGTYSETFNITAPATLGTYNAYFIAYDNDTCSSGPSSVVTKTSGVVVVAHTVIEFNSTGGTSATNGLHFYIDESTKIQVKRLDGSGQLYSPSAVPTSDSLDNGVFLRANGMLYGPSHSVGGFTPSGGSVNTASLTPASPANPSSNGVQQTATAKIGIHAGPQVNIVWKYTRPLDFMTAEVTLTVPTGYAVSPSNPVRYYHAIDTYLGGSDQGCGVTYIDANGKRMVGTYPPASGTTCPSSTAVPPGVTIVESFRERSGNFSHYCTGDWFNFWDDPASSTACAISRSVSLNDTVTTTYQDTGVAIEYDFTAAGTYTFSYDFVIGTTVVPNYDHIEILHDGTGALCPDNVTVLACLSSEIPCNAGNYVSAGVLTGTVTTSPTTPAVVWAPSASFSIGSSASTAALTIKGVAPGGTYTLSASGMSTTPLNGTKCWNTATGAASCSFVVTNGSCFADRMDACSNLTGTPARCSADASLNRLYTKVVGRVFDFDLVALNAGTPTTLNTSFSNAVQVDLVANPTNSAIDATTRCPATPLSISTAQSITFSSGRPAAVNTFNIPAGQNTRAFQDVRVRFDQGGGQVSCSSDQFSVRPAAFVLTQNTPNLNAGATFTLQASAVQDDLSTLTTDYVAAPALNLAEITGVSGFTQAALMPQALPTATAGVSSATFTYDDVGSFTLPASPGAYGVSDSSYVSVDAANGDCVAGSGANTVDSDGKVGCLIGQSAALTVGRFYPDHFDITPFFVAGCAADGFSYMHQPFQLGYTVTAKSLARNAPNPPGNTAAKLYSGGQLHVAALDSTTDWVSRLSLAASSPAVAIAAHFTPVWTDGSYIQATDSYVFTKPSSTSADATWGPFDALNIGVAVDDADGRGYSGGTSTFTAPTPATCAKTGAAECKKYAALTTGATKMRYGRLRMLNGYGSELLALPMTLLTQYWNGSGFVSHTLDRCTSLPVPTSVSGMVFGPGNLVAGETLASLGGLTTGSATVLAGDARLSLSRPGTGNNGYVDITITAPAWLQYGWTSSTPTNPTARATFGIFKSPLIYRRENY